MFLKIYIWVNSKLFQSFFKCSTSKCCFIFGFWLWHKRSFVFIILAWASSVIFFFIPRTICRWSPLISLKVRIHTELQKWESRTRSTTRFWCYKTVYIEIYNKRSNSYFRSSDVTTIVSSGELIDSNEWYQTKTIFFLLFHCRICDALSLSQIHIGSI